MTNNAYIKAYAVSLVRDGMSPAEAIEKATQAWCERQAAEKAVEQEMGK
jgi:hypothetical protein